MGERGVDFSNYQPVPSDADCQALVAAGITFAVVGLQVPSHASAQVDALRAHGIAVEDCYIENTAFPWLPAGMKRGWVAVETGGGFYTEQAIEDQLAYLRANGLEAGLYTSAYMLEHLGLTSVLGQKWWEVPLWLADYDGVDTLPWDIAMKQYSGSGRIPGIGYDLDLNVRHDPPAAIQIPEEAVQLRSLNPDETVQAADAEYALFSDVMFDQKGASKYEVTGSLPTDQNGVPVRVPAGGRVYLTVVPANGN